jgi:hypothetical protein
MEVGWSATRAPSRRTGPTFRRSSARTGAEGLLLIIVGIACFGGAALFAWMAIDSLDNPFISDRLFGRAIGYALVLVGGGACAVYGAVRSVRATAAPRGRGPS